MMAAMPGAREKEEVEQREREATAWTAHKNEGGQVLILSLQM